MAHINITDRDIRGLELKADLAYATLKRAVENSESPLISSAECLYYHDLGELLSKLTASSTAGIVSLRKGGKRASPIEKFILQCILMHKIPSEYDDGNYQTSLTLDISDGLGGLRIYLDAEDEQQSQRSEIFKLIQNRAEDLRNDGRHDLVLKAIEYVREKYKS